MEHSHADIYQTVACICLEFRKEIKASWGQLRLSNEGMQVTTTEILGTCTPGNTYVKGIMRRGDAYKGSSEGQVRERRESEEFKEGVLKGIKCG